MKYYKMLYQLAIKSRWITIWSKFRRLFQRKYLKVTINKLIQKENESLNCYFERVLQKTEKLQWKKDDFTHLWDSISLPGFVQHQINLLEDGENQENKSLDCDDYSVYYSHIICHKYKPRLLSVSYKQKDKFSFSGHMVCLLENENKFYHISNWGFFGPFSSVQEVANDIVKDREFIGYSIYDKKLKLKFMKV